MKKVLISKRRFINRLLFLFFGAILFLSCSIGEMPRENKTDPDAGNYTPAAVNQETVTTSDDCILGESRLGECGL